LVLPFWYRLTRVVPERAVKRVHVCVCVCVLLGPGTSRLTVGGKCRPIRAVSMYAPLSYRTVYLLSAHAYASVAEWLACWTQAQKDSNQRVAGVTAGLAEKNGSLPSGLWLTSPAGWLPRTRISSGTLRSVIEYRLFLSYASTMVRCRYSSLVRIIKSNWKLVQGLDAQWIVFPMNSPPG